jgi:hypothetical protein
MIVYKLHIPGMIKSLLIRLGIIEKVIDLPDYVWQPVLDLHKQDKQYVGHGQHLIVQKTKSRNYV